MRFNGWVKRNYCGAINNIFVKEIFNEIKLHYLQVVSFLNSQSLIFLLLLKNHEG